MRTAGFSRRRRFQLASVHANAGNAAKAANAGRGACATSLRLRHRCVPEPAIPACNADSRQQIRYRLNASLVLSFVPDSTYFDRSVAP